MKRSEKTVVGTGHDGQFGLRDQSVHFDRFLDGDEGIAITDHDQRRCGDTRKICYCTDDQAACRAAMRMSADEEKWGADERRRTRRVAE